MSAKIKSSRLILFSGSSGACRFNGLNRPDFPEGSVSWPCGPKAGQVIAARDLEFALVEQIRNGKRES